MKKMKFLIYLTDADTPCDLGLFHTRYNWNTNKWEILKNSFTIDPHCGVYMWGSLYKSYDVEKWENFLQEVDRIKPILSIKEKDWNWDWATKLLNEAKK